MSEQVSPNKLKIVLVEDDPILRNVVEFCLQHTYGATVIEAGSVKAGIDAIRDSGTFDCVISDYNLPDGTSGAIRDFLRSIYPKVPFVLMTAGDLANSADFSGQDKKPDYILKKPFTLEELEKALEKVVAHISPIPEETRAEYAPVKVDHLLEIGCLSHDLYIKLSDSKFVKVMRSGDYFERSDFEKLKLKNIDFLYVHHSDVAGFFTAFAKNLYTMDQSEQLDMTQAYQLASATIEFIQGIGRTFGWNDDVVNIYQKSVAYTVRTIQKNPKLALFLERITADPKSFLASYSNAVAFVSCGVAHSCGWGTDLTCEKLTMAAYVRDAKLSEGEFNQHRDFMKLFRDPNHRLKPEVREFCEHPKKAAALVMNWNEAPAEVAMIALQHHERPDKTGFPEGFDHRRIGALPSVMVFAESYVETMLDAGAMVDLKAFFSNHPEFYLHGNFRRIYNAVLEGGLA